MSPSIAVGYSQGEQAQPGYVEGEAGSHQPSPRRDVAEVAMAPQLSPQAHAGYQQPEAYTIPWGVRDILSIDPTQPMKIADLRKKVIQTINSHELHHLTIERLLTKLFAAFLLSTPAVALAATITLAILIDPIYLVLILLTVLILLFGGCSGMYFLEEVIPILNSQIKFIEKFKSAEKFYENTDSNAEFTLEDFLNHKQPPPNPIYTY